MEKAARIFVAGHRGLVGSAIVRALEADGYTNLLLRTRAELDLLDLAAVPTNLYGPGDRYDLQGSHVIPALVRKCHEAKAAGASEVVIWGTGSPLREFLYSDDAAGAFIHLMSLPEAEFRRACGDAEHPPLVNVGSGIELTIRELAQRVCDAVGYRGSLKFDASRPDGTPRKLLDVSRLASLGWRARTPLEAGLRNAYADFLARYAPNEPSLKR